MTKKEFFEELSKIKGWQWVVGLGLRRSSSQLRLWNECPITAVANSKGYEYGVDEYAKAASQLCLPQHFADAVVAAADKYYGLQAWWYRRKLKKVCQ